MRMNERSESAHQPASSRSTAQRPHGGTLGIVERARTAPLGEAEYAKLMAALETAAFLTQELLAKGTTIDRLRRMLFGASTENDQPGHR